MNRTQATGKKSASQEDGTQEKGVWVRGVLSMGEALLETLLLIGGALFAFSAHLQSLVKRNLLFLPLLWQLIKGIAAKVIHPLPQISMIGKEYISWGLIGLALFFFLFLPKYFLPPWFRVIQAIIWFVGLIVVLLELGVVAFLPMPPASVPPSKSPYAFTLDASKIKSDLDTVAQMQPESVVVVLVVNGQQYEYQAKILQMTSAATPVATCVFAPVTPCRNGGISTVSIELVDCSSFDSFRSELPNASTIYLFPASSTPTATPVSCS
jgi:hypothetical protein